MSGILTGTPPELTCANAPPARRRNGGMAGRESAWKPSALAPSAGAGGPAAYPQREASGPKRRRCDQAIFEVPRERNVRMNQRLLRRQEMEELTGLSRASIYKLMRSGRFPLPVRVSAAAFRWRVSDIAAWIQSRPVATSEIGSPTTAWEPPG